MNIIQVGQKSPFASKLIRKINPNVVFNLEEVSKNELNGSALIILDLKNPLSANEHDLINHALEQEAQLVIENLDHKKLPSNVLAGIDGHTCAIKSLDKGRTQKIYVKQASKPTEEIPTPTIKEDIKATKVISQDETAHPSASLDTISLKERIFSEEKSIANLIDWIQTPIKFNTSKTGDTHLVNASLCNISFIFEQQDKKMKRGSTSSVWGSFDMQLSACEEPYRSKYLKLASTDLCVKISDMGHHDDYRKGDFTNYGELKYYPGSWKKKLNDVKLPKGWRRLTIQPVSPNSETNYTKTTGWSIGASAGGEISEDPKVTVGLSASYSESTEESTTIKDFSVKNLSNAAACYWSYYLTNYVRDWKRMFESHGLERMTCKGLPDLATGTMQLQNESFYEIKTEAEQGWQKFYFELTQYTTYQYSVWEGLTNHYGFTDGDYNWIWYYLRVNLDAVRHKD